MTGNVDILLFPGAFNLFPLNLEGIADDGQELWNIPSGLEGRNYYIRVQNHNDPAIYGVSEYFNIKRNSYLQVFWPNGGEYWESGHEENIVWGHYFVDPLTSFVDIWLYHDAQWQLLVENAPDFYSYCTIIAPDIVSNQCLIRVYDSQDYTKYDDSDNFFSIGPAGQPSQPGTRVRLFYECMNYDTMSHNLDYAFADFNIAGGIDLWDSPNW